MSSFFACADALVVSLKDTKIFSMTIPGKLQSYLACGRPVIASLNGVGAEIISSSNSGLVCKAEDPYALANTIVKFNSMSKNKLKSFGINARKYFEKSLKETIY